MQREFRFKRFKIKHGGVSFPIGTDAVILGAYAGKTLNPGKILDMGTGSGIIALMLAQRFPETKIYAIEKNKSSYQQAKQNFAESPFSSRLELTHSDIVSFYPSLTFDLIVSNPPYFINSLKPETEIRNSSKHADATVLDNILDFILKHLTPNGIAQIIYPHDSFTKLKSKADELGLHFVSQLTIFPKENQAASRIVAGFSINKTVPFRDETLIIENQKRHDYHPSYIELCKAFYLKFPD